MWFSIGSYILQADLNVRPARLLLLSAAKKRGNWFWHGVQFDLIREWKPPIKQLLQEINEVIVILSSRVILPICQMSKNNISAKGRPRLKTNIFPGNENVSGNRQSASPTSALSMQWLTKYWMTQLIIIIQNIKALLSYYCQLWHRLKVCLLIVNHTVGMYLFRWCSYPYLVIAWVPKARISNICAEGGRQANNAKCGKCCHVNSRNWKWCITLLTASHSLIPFLPFRAPNNQECRLNWDLRHIKRLNSAIGTQRLNAQNNSSCQDENRIQATTPPFSRIPKCLNLHNPWRQIQMKLSE